MEFEQQELKASIKTVIQREKRIRKIATQGGKYKLKRSPFQSLDEKGLLTPDFIASEFALIQQKKSSLSAGERSVINQIAYLAIREASERKYQESLKEQAKQPKLKKPRAKKQSESKSNGRKKASNRGGTEKG